MPVKSLSTFLFFRALRFFSWVWGFSWERPLSRFRPIPLVTSRDFRKLRRDGVLVISDFISIGQCTNLRTQIDELIATSMRTQKNGPDMRVFGSERQIQDVIPFFSDLRLQKIARRYLGLPTKNEGTLANIVLASEHAFGSGGSWHRDANFPQFKALLYLSDVELASDGAFQYIKNSHKTRIFVLEALWRKRSLSDTRWSEHMVLSRYPKSQMTITGKAGTLVLFDSCLLHRGAPNRNPSGRARYAVTNYYRSTLGNFSADYTAIN